jgi:hypothetical protein
MAWDYIGARMTYDTTMILGHISATTTMLCGMNTFGISVYSKEYTFPILFLSRGRREVYYVPKSSTQKCTEI